MRSLERICLFVCLGRACIVIIQCILTRTELYGWIVNVLGTLTLKQSMFTYYQPSFSSSTWKRGELWMCKLVKLSESTQYALHKRH